jgi:hypothetical protein
VVFELALEASAAPIAAHKTIDRSAIRKQTHKQRERLAGWLLAFIKSEGIVL